MRLLVAIAMLVTACSSSPPPPPAGPPEPPAPTFAPIPTEAPPLIGWSGVITFGLAYDEETLKITKPQSSFKTTNKGIAWSAELSEPAGTTTLTIVLARVFSGGSEKLILKEDVDLSNPDFSILANKVDLAALADRKAGTYVMRYLRDGEVLAEGTFKLTKP